MPFTPCAGWKGTGGFLGVRFTYRRPPGGPGVKLPADESTGAALPKVNSAVVYGLSCWAAGSLNEARVLAPGGSMLAVGITTTMPRRVAPRGYPSTHSLNIIFIYFLDLVRRV